MCAGPELMMIASAVGTGVQFIASQSAEKKQRKLADAMTAYQMDKSRKAQAAAGEYIDQQDPQRREAARKEEEGQLANRYSAGVEEAKKFETPDAVAGKVSPDYRAERGRADATNAERLKRAVSQLATIGSPGARDITDATRYSTAAGNVAGIQDASRSVGGAFTSQIGNVRPDPFLNFAGQLATGAAPYLGGKRAPLVQEMAPGQYSTVNRQYGG